MKKELLSIENGILAHGSGRIFKRLYLQLFVGEALGLIFDNAHERRRLIQLFTGELVLDGGQITLLGEKLTLKECPRLFKKHIAMIERKKRLIRSISIRENIFLCAEQIPFFVGRHTYDPYVRELHDTFGIDLDSYPPVEMLSQKDRIVLEMMKAYVEGRRLIVFSNISSTLNENELEEIYSVTLKLRRQGVGFIVMEALDEILIKWTDNFSVIKNGRTVGVYDSRTGNAGEIFSALIKGDRAAANKMPSINQELDQEDWSSVLTMEGISTDHLTNFHLSIGKGEAVKIYCTDENSSNQIVDLLRGESQPVCGAVYLKDKPYTANNIWEAVREGVCLIEELPEEQMLMKNMTVFENVGLPLSEKIPGLWMRRRFQKNIREFLEQYLGEELLEQKLSDTDTIQLHQIIYYKWLLYHPKVVVCVKPFSQEDIHVRELTAAMIKVLMDRGIAVVILTAKFSDIHLIEGENIFVRDGRTIDENEVYQFLYEENNSENLS